MAHSVDHKQWSVEIQQLHRQVMEMISKQINKYRDRAKKIERLFNLRKVILFGFDYAKRGSLQDLSAN